MRDGASSKNILLFVCAALLSGCATADERKAGRGDEPNTLEDEVTRLRYKLESSREELSIVRKSFGGNIPPDLLSKAAAARKNAYPNADRERDLKCVKKSLEEEIVATAAEIKVMTFHLRTQQTANPEPDRNSLVGDAPIVPPVPITREQAITIAKQEILKRTGTVDIEVTSAECKNDHWVLVIWALPKTPGGYGILKVSQDGKVKTLGRGSR